ncbi:MAG TPA: aldo/keto reductase [Acidobacteriota bacterium]|nr:aldo/keto reductase [Acidobacteriota bacterium]
MTILKNVSRRNFMAGSVAALAPMAIPRLAWPSAQAGQAAKGGTVIRRVLGRTGLEIPVVSMGVMNADNPAVLHESYKAGVRLFDTSVRYQAGRNEEMIGSVVKSLGARKDIIIQTKIPVPRLPETATAEDVSRQFLSDLDSSLKRLQTDYVDILLIHGPDVAGMNNPGVMKALEEAKKQKRARFIGFATHAVITDMLNDAVRSKFYETITLSFNFTNAGDSALIAAIKKAAASGIGIIAMKTQATGRRGAPSAGPVNHTAALKWVLHHPEITTTIPGYTTFDHLKENFSVAYGLAYTDEEKRFLSDRNLLAQMRFCRQCSQCRPSCPMGVDIPSLMRTHMYAACYGNFIQARETFDDIQQTAGLNLCSDCSVCKAACARNIDIPGHIRDLKSMYL